VIVIQPLSVGFERAEKFEDLSPRFSDQANTLPQVVHHVAPNIVLRRLPKLRVEGAGLVGDAWLSAGRNRSHQSQECC
jgi:hypothetical protein